MHFLRRQRDAAGGLEEQWQPKVYARLIALARRHRVRDRVRPRERQARLGALRRRERRRVSVIWVILLSLALGADRRDPALAAGAQAPARARRQVAARARGRSHRPRGVELEPYPNSEVRVVSEGCALFETMSASRVRCLFFAAALAGLSLLASGCGGSKSPSVANLGTTSSSAAGSANATGGTARSGSPSGAPDAVAEGSAEVRPVHARQRCSQLSRPERQRRLHAERWEESLIACVQGGAGEVPKAHTRRRPTRFRFDDASLRAGACADGEGRAMYAPARHLRVPGSDDVDPIRPTRWRWRNSRSRRSDPRVAELARHAVAAVPEGGGRVRVPANQPLIGTAIELT